MKIFNKVSITTAFVASLALGFTGPSVAFATVAVAPNLGTAASFSVFGGSAMTADGSGATVSGDLGVNPGLSASGPWTVGGSSYFGTGGLSGTAKTDATAAWTSMNPTNQPLGTTWDPASPPDMTPAPGLYIRSGDATINTTLTLNGSPTDVWIFQINNDLTFTNAATVVLGAGVNACNVYWQIDRDATIQGSPGTQFVGTLIANSNVSLLTGATVVGRMMALTGTLSTGGVTNISGCATGAVVPVSSKQPATITVVKHVVNDGGGTKKISDFPLFVNGASVLSGVTNTFPAPALAYKVTETVDLTKYTRTFSGDCDLQGGVSLNPGDNKFCIITNNDIAAPIVPLVPPLMDVIKVASPLSLPGGPGLVTYTYTLRNIGIVPVENITMVGDTCSPIVLVSGDTNNDSKLDLNETWVHTCSSVISETHTNIVTATGWANGISAVDIARATVVVGLPVVPPLIHVTKVPSPLALRAGGGIVAYTKTVTNPGTVALSNVRLTDDKCNAVRFVYGDTNGDSKLDPTETWVYTCSMMMTETTTNTVIAEGDANGLTARDIALATVVVAATPMLPNTGYAGTDNGLALPLFAVGMFMFVSVMVLRKRIA
ncbi:MAG: hypothetical protein A2845_03115 [Candidatus Lloydbacteria bacterium RIFCSPHIGHO2_01_FULL_49_22]|uniref:DUF7507 domain-containing protein n=1 Tax=Candidatus Lloydbacteria bacterium RIFCSPHIGHO2_01_FULL_49_22 TaxID=1798658 RepID=A0A1G2CV98_9BACT|nr:MAG: hypothetical protein A2845_03115 [Candidatus Lloydbacteria bacterium RIFCSPHIGHO2_01_FULL_49_22]OGZ10425.1 MAG: hypothetical protein A3C14_02810 [Candidatus Lloydbacteria bacterium RIFCSPHIGHO2_02_FULL_50_18]